MRLTLNSNAHIQFVFLVLALSVLLPAEDRHALAQDFDPFATDQLPEQQGKKPAPVQDSSVSAPPASLPDSSRPVEADFPAESPAPGASALPTVPASPAEPAAPRKPAVKKTIKKAKPKKAKPAAPQDPESAQVKSAEENESTPEPPPPATGEFQLSTGLENAMTLSFLKTSFDFAKYSADTVLFPFLDLQNQLRPTFKLTSGRAFTLNARPFLEIRQNQFLLSSGKNKSQTEISADAGETTLSIRPSNKLELTVGQESFQWGAGETASPSNWIHRPTRLLESVSRNPQTVVSTQKTARLNASAGQFLNLVAVAEYEIEQKALPSIYSGRRFLLKSEFAWNSGVDSVGLVIGGAERLAAPFLGQYFSLSIDDSLRIYAESGHYQGSDVLKPVELGLPSPSGVGKAVLFSQPQLSSKRFNHEVLLGIRYDIFDGTELRLEGYSNSAGYTLSEMKLAADLQKQSSQSFPLFYSPNTETRSQKSLLLAVRKANFGKKRNNTALIRYWKPVFDSSGGAVLYCEYGLNDNVLLYAAGGGYHGPLVSEAGLPHRFVLLMGQKYVW